MGTKEFRPKLTFEPGQMRAEDQHIAIYVLHAPYDKVKDMLGGLFCAIEGPAELIEGDTRTPIVAREDIYQEMKTRAGGAPTDRGSYGMLVWQPHEAPHLTVIEKPLDGVGPDSIYLPKAISQFDPTLRITAFHSDMEVKSRTLHGFSVRQGDVLLRDYEVSKGIEKTGWHEISSGTQIPWENADRLGERYISKRLDRALLFEYFAALGIDLERSLFRRDFAQSFAMLPLTGAWPHDDRMPTRVFQRSADRARSMGIVTGIGEEMSDAEFEAFRAYQNGDDALLKALASQAFPEPFKESVARSPIPVEATPRTAGAVTHEMQATLFALSDQLRDALADPDEARDAFDRLHARLEHYADQYPPEVLSIMGVSKALEVAILHRRDGDKIAYITAQCARLCGQPCVDMILSEEENGKIALPAKAAFEAALTQAATVEEIQDAILAAVAVDVPPQRVFWGPTIRFAAAQRAEDLGLSVNKLLTRKIRNALNDHPATVAYMAHLQTGFTQLTAPIFAQFQ